MGGVLVAIATLVITFVLAGYGVYHNVESSQRTQIAMSVGQSADRLANYNQERVAELGGRTLYGDEEAANGTGYANYNEGTKVLLQEQKNDYGITYRFHSNVTGYYVCASTARTDAKVQEAFQMVARDRPGGFVSGACGESGVAVGGLVVFSIRVQ